MNEHELKIRSDTNVHHLATSIVRCLDEGKDLILSCIGVQSISQAVKSVAVANGHTAPQGFVLCLLPSFRLKEITDRESGKSIEMTAIQMTVVKQRLRGP